MGNDILNRHMQQYEEELRFFQDSTVLNRHLTPLKNEQRYFQDSNILTRQTLFYNPPKQNSSGEQQQDDRMLTPEARLLSRVLEQNHLKKEANERLMNVVKSLLSAEDGEAYKNIIETAGVSFSDVRIDPNLKGLGGYDPQTGALLFKSINSIREEAFFEEFIHLSQDRLYIGGITQYNYKGRPNIEFEAKVIADLIRVQRGFGAELGKGPINIKKINKPDGTFIYIDETPLNNSYEDWIKMLLKISPPLTFEKLDNCKIPIIATDGNSYDYGYRDFMLNFRTKDPQYNKPYNEPKDVKPLLLMKVFNYIKK